MQFSKVAYKIRAICLFFTMVYNCCINKLILHP
jgi:hypothetical protein